MRGRMNDVKSYAAAVRARRAARRRRGRRGDRLPRRRSHAGRPPSLHGLGWRELAVVDAASARPVDVDVGARLRLPRRARHDRPDRVRRADPRSLSSARATPSSSPAPPARSAASSARSPSSLGAGRVIGSAGSPAKVRAAARPGLRRRLRLPRRPGRRPAAAARTGRHRRLLRQRRRRAPRGGHRRDATTADASPCAARSPQYNSTEPPAAPRNLAAAIGTRDHPARLPGRRPAATSPRSSATTWRGGWPTAGSSSTRPSCTASRTRRPRSSDCMRGENTGKMVVTL